MSGEFRSNWAYLNESQFLLRKPMDLALFGGRAAICRLRSRAEESPAPSRAIIALLLGVACAGARWRRSPMGAVRAGSRRRRRPPHGRDYGGRVGMGKHCAPKPNESMYTYATSPALALAARAVMRPTAPGDIFAALASAGERRLAGRLLRSGHRLLALFDQLLRCGDILRIAAQG